MGGEYAANLWDKNVFSRVFTDEADRTRSSCHRSHLQLTESDAIMAISFVVVSVIVLMVSRPFGDTNDNTRSEIVQKRFSAEEAVVVAQMSWSSPRHW